jgi:hypothetical protein
MMESGACVPHIKSLETISILSSKKFPSLLPTKDLEKHLEKEIKIDEFEYTLKSVCEIIFQRI